MKVAIIGGGFGGLSVATKLAKHCEIIRIFDPLPPGSAGASSIAGGLMHPLAPRGNLVWKGLEGLEATLSSLKLLDNLGYKGIIRPNTGLIRPVYKREDIDSWRKAAVATPDLVEELEHSDVPPIVSQGNKALAYFRISKATVFNPPVYLHALWSYTRSLCSNSEWIFETVEDLSMLTKAYDRVVIAGGHGSPSLFRKAGSCATDLNVQYVRGRIYQYDNCFGEKQAITSALLSGEYVVPNTDPENGQQVLYCGASHDHLKESDALLSDYLTYTYRNKPMKSADVSVEDAKLQAKLLAIYPSLIENHKILSESSGIRLVTKRSNLGRLPIVGQHPEQKQVFILSGLGARGLVYHALMADYLAEAVVTGNLDGIPSCLQPAAHVEAT
eukprot:gene37770-45885_t